MYKALVIGSGCAGLACAARLGSLGAGKIAVVTEGINSGTSRNTGSDKQTYYKLSMGGDNKDSVIDFAKDLYAGGGINGELALTEAANSARAFLYLCELGVNFPVNEYGEYIGYRTDHDTHKRAVSCGPLTSKYMTKALELEVLRQDVEIYNFLRAVKLIVKDNTVCGAIFIDTRSDELVKIDAEYIILATGGEASVYENSVFPPSQWGGMGLFFEAGATFNNMNCWQYGIASKDFRWNLSGSYQQALPRYVTKDKNGIKSELLPKYIHSNEDILNKVFLKGYEWPFDVKKLSKSSNIDAIIHHETMVLGNSVYLDYTTNPSGLENGFDVLSPVCFSYLKNCNALLSTPIKRLRAMNEKAYQLYLSHNIDLEKDLLKIGVAAQHQNGGAAVDMNYETSVKNLFAIGEAAGVFGAYRPGGSALNSTQVGALRAAQAICRRPSVTVCSDENELLELEKTLKNAVNNNGIDHMKLLSDIKIKMSNFAGPIRNAAKMSSLLNKLKPLAENYFDAVSANSGTLTSYLKTRDTLFTACCILSAAVKSAKEQGSLGSAAVYENENSSQHLKVCEENRKNIVETKGFISTLKAPTPIPERETWFENLL
ncbi:MAG TPA: FAD-binding protein [Oscillospiraceae bacterium]|nr:FAD-binding protein [Oscillospiraceae bacterium]